MSATAPLPVAHSLHEDLLALVTGTLFVGLGLVMLGHARLVTGGTAGLALLLHYASDWEFAACYFVVNLPFYGLAWWRLGPAFTLKTLAAVSALSAVSWVLPRGLAFGQLSPVLAALLGGLLCGVGMLMLVRHRASLGGFNVVVLYLQERLGWRAGKVQLVLDTVMVVAGSLAVADPQRLALSVLAAVAMNLTIAVNHRPGRYLGA